MRTQCLRGGLDNFRSAVEAEPVPEASDRFSTVWKGRDVIWFEKPESRYPIHLWALKDRYEQIKALLNSEG